MHDKQPRFKQRIAAAFSGAAARYDAAAVVQRVVGEAVISRLDCIRLNPSVVLDLGAGTGQITQVLQQRYPDAELIAVDLAPAMVEICQQYFHDGHKGKALCADAEALPLEPQSVDLIVCNLMLQWLPQLETVLAQIKRVLRPGGLFMFSTFGPDTLCELRASWSTIDEHAHVNSFLDMHDVGDAVLQAGLCDPVLEAEHITVRYSRLRDLLQDLRDVGGHTVLGERRQGLLGKAAWQRLQQAYQGFADEDNKLPATYEVVYGHAWADSASRRSMDTVEGPQEVHIPINSLRQRD